MPEEGMTDQQVQEALKNRMEQSVRESVLGPDSLTQATEADNEAIMNLSTGDGPFDASGRPTPAEETVDGVQAETVTEEVTETQETEVTPERTKLSTDEMQEMYATGIVNGEEVEYSLDKLLAIAQTQDAASERLDRTKGLERELRSEIDRVKEMQTALTVKPETKPEE